MNKPVLILNLGILFRAEDQENKLEQGKSLSIEKGEPREKHIPQKINLNKTITIIVFLIIIFIFYLFYRLLIKPQTNQPNILNSKPQSDQLKKEDAKILESHAQKNQSQAQTNISNPKSQPDQNIQAEKPKEHLKIGLTLTQEEIETIKSPLGQNQIKAKDLLEKYNTDCLFFFPSFETEKQNDEIFSLNPILYMIFKGTATPVIGNLSIKFSTYNFLMDSTDDEYGIAKLKKIKPDFDVRVIPERESFDYFIKNFKDRAITYEEMLDMYNEKTKNQSQSKRQPDANTQIEDSKHQENSIQNQSQSDQVKTAEEKSNEFEAGHLSQEEYKSNSLENDQNIQAEKPKEHLKIGLTLTQEEIETIKSPFGNNQIKAKDLLDKYNTDCLFFFETSDKYNHIFRLNAILYMIFKGKDTQEIGDLFIESVRYDSVLSGTNDRSEMAKLRKIKPDFDRRILINYSRFESLAKSFTNKALTYQEVFDIYNEQTKNAIKEDLETYEKKLQMLQTVPKKMSYAQMIQKLEENHEKNKEKNSKKQSYVSKRPNNLLRVERNYFTFSSRSVEDEKTYKYMLAKLRKNQKKIETLNNSRLLTEKTERLLKEKTFKYILEKIRKNKRETKPQIGSNTQIEDSKRQENTIQTQPAANTEKENQTIQLDDFKKKMNLSKEEKKAIKQPYKDKQLAKKLLERYNTDCLFFFQKPSKKEEEKTKIYILFKEEEGVTLIFFSSLIAVYEEAMSDKNEHGIEKLKKIKTDFDKSVIPHWGEFDYFANTFKDRAITYQEMLDIYNEKTKKKRENEERLLGENDLDQRKNQVLQKQSESNAEAYDQPSQIEGQTGQKQGLFISLDNTQNQQFGLKPPIIKTQESVVENQTKTQTESLDEIKKKINDRPNLTDEEKTYMRRETPIRAENPQLLDLLDKYKTDCLFLFEKTHAKRINALCMVLKGTEKEIDKFSFTDNSICYAAVMKYGLARVKKIKPNFDVKAIPSWEQLKDFTRNFEEKAITYEEMLVLCKKQ